MVDIYTLKNGITVAAEYIGYVRSVSVGVFVKGGSRSECRSQAGISHMIEHMLFKGTQSRSAKDIAEEIDAVGGNLNAYTTKEYTCYYAKVLDTHLDLALDVISDMLTRSKLDKADIDLERRVIMEEIGMCEDTPEDLVHDMIMEAAWGNGGLGGSIIGSKETLDAINQEVLKQYIQDNYTANNIVISVVGNFEAQSLRSMLEQSFGAWDTGSRDIVFGGEKYNSNTMFQYRDIQQTHTCLGLKAYSSQDDRIYALMAFNNIFGSGMSSRLFQKVREEKGLVYSIYSYLNLFVDTGMFVIAASMNPDNTRQVLDIIYDEMDTAKKEILDERTLYKAKEQLKGNYILGLENLSSRMQGVGRAQLLQGRVRTPEEILQNIDNITVQGIRQCVDDIFDYDHLTVSAIGNLESEDAAWYFKGGERL